MKISLNWIREFIDFELPPIDELVDKIGGQLGAVEAVTDLGQKYQGIVVVKVVSCQDHPDADRLHVCKIDDGGKVQNVERDENGHVQVVCGAPNVREGLMVAWLPPGSTVPSSIDSDPFLLEAKDLRGVKSNGMLASAKELAIGDSHEGLLIVDSECLPGADFAEIYKLNDHIIDIENKMFTHRPDCFGMLGVAREIAGITGHQFVSPSWYKTFTKNLKPAGPSLPLTIKNELPTLVPRFMAVAISNVEIKPSSVWIQSYLSRVGVRPINNVVDVTNYMMLLTGQPLHAYDYDKVKALSDGDAATIVVRNPHSGEKLQLINGKEITPRAEAILIATNKQAIGLGGVMGGAETEVSSETKNIILECASFDMYSIRRTSMEQGIFSDAVTRFTKGQSPLQNDRVLMESARTICDLGAAEFASELIDDIHLESDLISRNCVHPAITVPTEFINQRLGLKLTDKDVETLLSDVEFHVDVKGHSISAPFWRTDIEQREDVVEEVGRLYGFDRLSLELPLRDITPSSKDPLLATKAQIRAALSAAGANEILTYSFVHGNLLANVGQKPDDAFKLGNALSPDLQYYRLSLLPSLLDKVRLNLKAGYDEFVLFEIGKVHSRERPADTGGLPAEDEYTALVVAANDKLPKSGSAYYQARKYLVDLVGVPLEFKPMSADTQTFAVMQPYQPGRTALVSVRATGKFLGLVGEFKPSVAAKLKLPKYCAGFELDTTALQEVLASRSDYVALPKYPKVQQDVSLKVPLDVTYQQLYDFIRGKINELKPEQIFATLGPIDIYQRDDDTEHKQITLRLSIASYEKTMTDQEVNTILDAAAASAKEQFGAERI